MWDLNLIPLSFTIRFAWFDEGVHKCCPLHPRRSPLILQLSSATATPLSVPQLRAHFPARTPYPASARDDARTPAPNTTRFTPAAHFLQHLRYPEGHSAPPPHTHERTHAAHCRPPLAGVLVPLRNLSLQVRDASFIFSGQTRLCGRFNRHQRPLVCLISIRAAGKLCCFKCLLAALSFNPPRCRVQLRAN